MTVLISQSFPTLKVLHATRGGSAKKVPNQPFNDQGHLYATGGGVARGWSGLYVDAKGGMQVTIGNAEFFDGTNAVRLWNHDKDRAQVIEVPVRPVWYSVNGRSELLVSRYLCAAEVKRLGFESGDQLALQSTVRRRGAGLPKVTLAPVFLESQVLSTPG